MSGPPPDLSASEVDPLVGRMLGGKFVIERRLGAGAMGAVYRAVQTALDRTVAIKVMHREIAADPMYAARFNREAKAVSRLDHPNLIRVLDYGQEPDGLLYIAMEFLDGRDLFAAIEDDWPLPHERMVDILSQTLSALAEAHDAGVLHRDLKPENIMLLRKKGEDGRPVDLVKVCDFGIAKVSEEVEARSALPSSGRRQLTTAGLVMGTPGYMSPEQARSAPCDARSDIYAIGVILYQMLTRRLPFEGNTPLDVVVKALHEAPPPLGSYGPTAAPGLEPVCEKAMSKRPEERYQSARDMRAALRAAPVLERQVVIAGADRPSIVNAPTQLELSAPSASAGARVVPTPAPPARFRRAGGVLAGLAVAGIAVFAFTTSRYPPPVPIAIQPQAASPAIAISVTAPAAPSAASPPPVAITPPPIADTAAAPTPSAVVKPGHHPPREQRDPEVTPPTPPSAVVAAPATPAPPPPDTSSIAAAPTTAAAPPAAPPTPAPPPAVAPAAPAPSTFNVATARVEVGQARTNNAAATGSAVSRAIAPFAPRFTACYRAALAQATSASDASASLHIESDDQGYVTTARLTGPVPASAARCIEGLVTRDVKIDVDTGTANADVTLRFEPL